eukprot:2613612-Pleurochrysis_carterae.AAC.3
MRGAEARCRPSSRASSWIPGSYVLRFVPALLELYIQHSPFAVRYHGHATIVRLQRLGKVGLNRFGPHRAAPCARTPSPRISSKRGPGCPSQCKQVQIRQEDTVRAVAPHQALRISPYRRAAVLTRSTGREGRARGRDRSAPSGVDRTPLDRRRGTTPPTKKPKYNPRHKSIAVRVEYCTELQLNKSLYALPSKTGFVEFYRFQPMLKAFSGGLAVQDATSTVTATRLRSWRRGSARCLCLRAASSKGEALTSVQRGRLLQKESHLICLCSNSRDTF